MGKPRRLKVIVEADGGSRGNPGPAGYGAVVREAVTGETLVEGMTFTVEPMINAGRREIRELADGWTIVTKDHSLSAQWEHTVLVTASGYDVLTISAGAPAKPALPAAA